MKLLHLNNNNMSVWSLTPLLWIPIVRAKLTDRHNLKSQMECNVLLLYLPPNITGGCLLWSFLALFKSLFITRAYFRRCVGDEGLKEDVLEGRRAHWGGTAGRRCLSGLLAPHQDYCRQKARGQDNRLRPDNLFIPYRKNIIRDAVSCFYQLQMFSCWRFGFTSAQFIRNKVQYVAASSQAWMTS